MDNFIKTNDSQKNQLYNIMPFANSKIIGIHKNKFLVEVHGPIYEMKKLVFYDFDSDIKSELLVDKNFKEHFLFYFLLL